jgi:hypothetical protein
LPIERDSPQARAAIEFSEAALKEIEQSNGYASTEPDERNGIVETIKGTLNAWIPIAARNCSWFAIATKIHREKIF